MMGRKNSRGFAVLPLIILILFILAGGIWFFLKKVPSTPSSPESPSGSAAIPDDWLEYQNPTYHYQINYPPQFHAQGENEPPYPPPPTGMAFTYRWENKEYCDFTILASNDQDGFSGEIENIREQKRDTESKTIIDGVEAIVFDTQGGDAINRTYYLSSNSLHWRFGYNYRPAALHSQECADVVSKMVSSFKFLD